ncbi:hypothetical protein PILCRDRAFT_133937 [Piloderma croceum F 1598]|uniref:Uncharacterized protein n=1 Tax=Piloderma croceum (strain F 1598) TaxID=765440 RepID=A0A0C3CPL4_PILCF|nr:hypothetical protein PILCRDRAFT_133937 [Piloderma croceum F 1598]
MRHSRQMLSWLQSWNARCYFAKWTSNRIRTEVSELEEFKRGHWTRQGIPMRRDVDITHQGSRRAAAASLKLKRLSIVKPADECVTDCLRLHL